MSKYTTDHDRPTIFNQNTRDYGTGCDKESTRIYEMMTGSGLVTTEKKVSKPPRDKKR
jgi:hypothetical protein